jgi:hypothetical protein
MTFYSDLLTAVEARTESEYSGTLAELGDAVPFDLSLPKLLELRDYLRDAGASAGTIVLAVFKAVGAGTGYSIDDIIILRQTPPDAAEYYNATTAAVIATPDPADLGSVSSASNVTVVGALPTGANAIGSITNTAFTANAGTDLNTSLLALESGGNLAGINTKLGSALPLPTDASTSALQAEISGKLPSSLGAKASTDSISQANAQAQATLTQLTAAGSTAAVSMLGYTRAFITLLVASIDTNVVVRIEGTNDGTNWTNLSTANTDTTITANGTYGFVFVGCPASIRVTFVSESGGTAVTIDAIVRVSA